MKPFFRTYTFWIALFLWIGSVGGNLTQLIPGPTGLITANVVALGYAMARCLQKRAAGVPWKSILLTSELAISVGTIAANVLEAVSQFPGLSTGALTGLTVAIGVLTKLLHSLSDNSQPLVDSNTKKIMDDIKGQSLGIAVLVLGSLLLSSSAQAQTSDRQFGGCIESQSLGEVCLGPSAAVSVGQYKNGKFVGGVLPGVGYGATAWANQWYQTGLALYMAFQVGGTTSNFAVPSLMFSFADYLRFGAGVEFVEKPAGGVDKSLVLNFAFGADFGGPSPAQAYKNQMKAKEASKESAQ